LPVNRRSGVFLCLLRHYRLRLTAGLVEDDLVSVLDGVNDLDEVK
jgi:hypothetical protein